jgi:hypothetical protein
MPNCLRDCEYTGTIDPSWLRPPVSLDEFFAFDVRHLFIRRRPKRRAELETEMAADRDLIEGTVQPADELRPWIHRFDPTGPSGCMGVAVVRDGSVIKAWCTAILC